MHPAQPAVSTRDATLAMVAGFLGWTLDAFDFFLVPISVGAIAKEFKTDTATILFSTMLTLMFRPLGALIFGLLADRYGRRAPMMINLVFYSAIEVATGFAPDLATFFVLRALFGIGMGGEWGVGTSLVMEKVPPRWRGLLSGLLQEGYACGYLLAAVAAHYILEPHGWRPLFYLGGLPALLALFIRFFVKESEVWHRSKAESWSHLGRAISSHWKTFLYLTLLMAMMNFASHGTQDSYPDFLKKFHGMAETQYTDVVMIIMLGAIVGGLVFGLASDRFGRRLMMTLAFLGALCVVPLWAFSTDLTKIVAGGFLMQFMIQGAWGTIPAHISELSPDQVRGFLPGFAYQCGNLIASSIGFVEAALAPSYGYPPVLATCASLIFLAAIAVIIFGPERRGLQFGASNVETLGEVAEQIG